MKRKIFDSIYWILLITITLIWTIDYFNVAFKKEPMFCVTEEIKTYKDGYIKTCNGLGYKIKKYNRESLTKGYTYDFIGDK
ncbi:MAG: hypothetical protein RSD09_03035 [Bacilli bacterium]